jgi:hypothetical protein
MDKLIIDIADNCLDTIIYNNEIFEFSDKIFCSRNMNNNNIEIFKKILKDNVSIKTVIYENINLTFEDDFIPQNANRIIFNNVHIFGFLNHSYYQSSNVKTLHFNSTKEIVDEIITSFYYALPNVECISFNERYNIHVLNFKRNCPVELKKFQTNEMKFLHNLITNFKKLERLIYPMDDETKKVIKQKYPKLSVNFF